MASQFPTEASAPQDRWHSIGRTLNGERPATALIYVALLACFAVTNFTNGVIMRGVRALLQKGPEWPGVMASRMRDATGDYYTQYLLASVKDAIFFVSLMLFALLLRSAFSGLWPQLARRKLWADILIAFLIASIFLLALRPIGMGSIYANVSVEPFLQEPGFYHRRILLPVLAHDLHLSGVFYILVYWAIVAITFALASLYLERRNLTLTRIELASLYTVGMFGSALGQPGYVEILVFGLTLLAMLDFDREGMTGPVQTICFGLALLTHETAAVLAFGTLALFMFDRRFLLHFAALLSLYLIVWLASFGLDLSTATAVQLTGGMSNAGRFPQAIPLVLLSVFLVYKMTLPAAVWATARLTATRDYRAAALIVAAIVGGAALTMIATDYTRMVSFGSIAILVALPVVLPRLTARQRLTCALLNLLLPTLYVGARAGVLVYPGLYGVVMSHGFGLRG